MAEKIIEFDRVVAGYSESLTILNETTLDVRKGEITLLIGPNGAGKSTVLKTLFGLLVPRSGEVRFEGRVINGRSQRALRVHVHEGPEPPVPCGDALEVRGRQRLAGDLTSPQGCGLIERRLRHELVVGSARMLAVR